MLSTYLTDAEWDGAFYVFKGPKSPGDLGCAIISVIRAAHARGHTFQGIDKDENKLDEVPSNNQEKLASLCLAPDPDAVLMFATLNNGRNFIKEIAPELLTETQEEWDRAMGKAAALIKGLKAGAWHPFKVLQWFEAEARRISDEFPLTSLDREPGKVVDAGDRVRNLITFLEPRALVGIYYSCIAREMEFTSEDEFRDFMRRQTSLDVSAIEWAIREIRG